MDKICKRRGIHTRDGHNSYYLIHLDFQVNGLHYSLLVIEDFIDFFREMKLKKKLKKKIFDAQSNKKIIL